MNPFLFISVPHSIAAFLGSVLFHAHELNTRTLKQQLQKLPGIPPRFRQRLLHQGSSLEDGAFLDSAIDLQLLLLTFIGPCQKQADELTLAAETGALERVEALLQLPQDPDLASITGQRPLARAARQGHMEIARLLLEAGAKKDLGNHSGSTALMFASQQGHLEIARLLLELGADKDSC